VSAAERAAFVNAVERAEFASPPERTAFVSPAQRAAFVSPAQRTGFVSPAERAALEPDPTTRAAAPAPAVAAADVAVRVDAGPRGRVLVAKVGLDGHDRGVKVVGRILRDAGFEVIYTGLQQTPAMVVAAARDEDVDLIVLSLLSGAHMTLVPRILDDLRAQQLDIPVVVGGIIPAADGIALRDLGVAAILTPGASSREIVAAVTAALVEHAAPPEAPKRAEGPVAHLRDMAYFTRT